MYDFISADLKGHKLEWFLGQDNLSFETDKKNKWIKRAEYNGIDFIYYNETKIGIRGSLHKNWNDGRHNYNDFYLNDLLDTLNNLYDGFSINPLLWHIHSIEYGVNIKLPMPAKTFIQRFILAHKNKCKPSANTFKGNGYLIEFDYGNYRIKIYDKSLQYNRPGNLLRFEVGVERMEHLKRYGIETPLTIFNLLHTDTLRSFNKLLLDTFDEMVIIDPECKDRRNLLNYLKSDNKNSNDYLRIGKIKEGAYKFSNIKAQIRELISSKVNDLTRVDKHFQNKLLHILYEWQNSINLNAQTDTLRSDIGEINTIYKGVNFSNQEKRYCQTCGRDISDQKPGSKFCSALYVGESAAKACRNGDSNPRNYIKRRIREISENCLFDTMPFVDPGKLALIESCI